MDRQTREFTDIAGVTHQVVITRRPSGNHYVARMPLADTSGSGESAEGALQQLIQHINSNRPEQFDLEPPEKQEQLVAWIVENLREGAQGKTRHYHSYYLKHLAEHCIGEYVSNGEMKGAMQKAGFKPTKDTNEYDTNWEYSLQRGLGYLRGEHYVPGLTEDGFKRLTQSLPKIGEEPEATPPAEDKPTRTTKHKSTIGPSQCAHCHLVWYGMFCDSEHRPIVPPDTILCVSCWSSLDRYLYRTFSGIYQDAHDSSTPASAQKTESIFALNAEAKKWIDDKKKKPLPRKRIYHKSVPAWMRSAIDAGLVEPNSDKVYIVYSQGNVAIKVDVTERKGKQISKKENVS